MLQPISEGRQLIFRCNKPGCNFKLKVTNGDKIQNLVSRREFMTRKNLIVRPEFAKDPTMPREVVECPSCGHNEAVFFITTDLEDTKIELIFICTNRECGHDWKKEAPDAENKKD